MFQKCGVSSYFSNMVCAFKHLLAELRARHLKGVAASDILGMLNSPSHIKILSKKCGLIIALLIKLATELVLNLELFIPFCS